MTNWVEKMRDEVPWRLMLYDVFEFDTSLERFTEWVEEYADDQGMEILGEDGVPISSLAKYFSKMEAQYGDRQFKIVLLQKDFLTKQDFPVSLEVAPLEEGGVEARLYADGVFASEAYYYCRMRDDFAKAFPHVPRYEETRRGAPYLMHESQRRHTVRQWKQAARRGEKKVDFVRGVVVPGNVSPGISVKTLNRWIRDFPDE